MTEYIPFQQLDHFYFQEIIPSLPASLQSLAIDRRILHHEPESRAITTTQDIYQRQYSYIPFVLNDIFGLANAEVFQLGCAWLLGVIDFVLMDNLVDGQSADYQQVTIFVAYLRQLAQSHFRRSLPIAIHHTIDTAFMETWHALALETESVDAHRTPYTLTYMTTMYHKKATLFRLVIQSMGALSGNQDAVVSLETLYDRMSLADQLLDDAMDWEKDFRAGRWFLPIVMALELAGKPYETADHITPSQMEKLMLRFEIQSRVAQIAQDHLLACKSILQEHNWSHTQIASVIEHRLNIAQQAQNRYAGQKILSRFLSAFGD